MHEIFTGDKNLLVVGPDFIDVELHCDGLSIDSRSGAPSAWVNNITAHPGAAGSICSSLRALGVRHKSVVAVEKENKGEASDDCYTVQVPGYGKAIRARVSSVYDNDRILFKLSTDSRKAKTSAYADKVVEILSNDNYDGVIIADYDSGLISDTGLDRILDAALKNDVMSIVDGKLGRRRQYVKADYVSINYAEHCDMARAFSPDVHMKPGERIRLGLERILSRHKEGCAFIDFEVIGDLVKSPPVKVVDSCGAGDASTAALAAAVVSGVNDRYQLCQLANAAGAASTEVFGAVRPLTRRIFQNYTFYDLNYKKLNFEEAKKLTGLLKEEGSKIVVANGVFDILHPGHITLLEEAASNGDFVIVLMNSDKSAEEIKRKPIQPASIRAFNLCVQPTVSAVVEFSESTCDRMIKELCPDVVVKGPDYKEPTNVPEYETAVSIGASVIISKDSYDYSTSKIINTIVEREAQRHGQEKAPEN